MYAFTCVYWKEEPQPFKLNAFLKYYYLKKELLNSCILRSEVYDCGVLELINVLF